MRRQNRGVIWWRYWQRQSSPSWACQDYTSDWSVDRPAWKDLTFDNSNFFFIKWDHENVFVWVDFNTHLHHYLNLHVFTIRFQAWIMSFPPIRKVSGSGKLVPCQLKNAFSDGCSTVSVSHFGWSCSPEFKFKSWLKTKPKVVNA